MNINFIKGEIKMKTNKLIKNLVVLLMILLTASVCHGQFFNKGGYQGGGHGSGGNEILVKIEDREIENEEDVFITFPNPFHTETTIKFTLTTNTRVELNVYNVNSKLIKSLIPPTRFSKGKHIIIWDGRDDHGNKVSRGVYYYKFKTGNKVYTRKIIYM